MKVLVIASDKGGCFSPFVEEQISALERVNRGEHNCIGRYYVKGKGVKGYLAELPKLKKVISDLKPDIIHAHFGLCGLLANLQREVPVVTTYHGCDINNPKLRILSYPSLLLSQYNIFVSAKQAGKVAAAKGSVCGKPWRIIPCGVDTAMFHPTESYLNDEKKRVLFCSNFNRPEKNAELAKLSIEELRKRTGWDVELIPLEGYSRQQVVELINKCDCGLISSIREGSPQFSKEVLACGKPIVSTNVGDVEEQFMGVSGAYIAESNAEDVASKLQDAIDQKKALLPADWASRYDNNEIARQLLAIYMNVKNK